jgi:isoquinoline 1-oxidoreductase
MSSVRETQLEIEIQQHEVDGSLHQFDLDRRDFLKLLGGGIFICACTGNGIAQESGRMGRSHELPKDISAWLHIAEDGKVIVFTGKVEVGQNIRTSLAQQVAEELRVPTDAISLVMGDTDRVPWDAGTFGSRTTPTMGPQLRTMAVAARELLVSLAAKEWQVDPSILIAADAKITNPKTRQSRRYGELTNGQKLVKVIDSDPAFTPASQWKITGQPIPKVDGEAFVTGRHEYASDISLPGMLYGKILRPTGFNATLTLLDDSGIKKLPNVTLVRDGDFVGVAGPDLWSAQQALDGLKAQWKIPPQISNAELFAYLKANADNQKVETADAAGSIADAIAAAEVKVSQVYTVAYIQHAPLEPRAAVAEWQGDKLTVWTGTQRPFAVRDELAAAFRTSPQNVHVLMPDTGSAYGGKHTGDAAVEAARLAKAAGKPVKVVWTREEEFTWAYSRPAGVIEIKSGARRDGVITAWDYHNYNSGPAAIGAHTTSQTGSSSFTPSTDHHCGRARIVAWQRLPTTSPASRTWTRWRMPSTWIPCNSASKTLRTIACALSLKRLPKRQRGASKGQLPIMALA